VQGSRCWNRLPVASALRRAESLPDDATRMNPVPALALEGITCAFGAPEGRGQRYTAVRDTTLFVAAGGVRSRGRPARCGQSTLLNVAAGLLTPSAGTVKVLGERLDGLNRRAGYIFQAEALMPWRSALQNVAAGLEFRGVPRRAALEQGDVWLRRVGLGGVGGRYPHPLSGGVRKRVALAQTLILNPQILLIDAPVPALLVQTRHLMGNRTRQLLS